MNLRETNVDERLDLLENVENGEVFLYDRRISQNRFHNKTVATIMQNKDMTHAIIVFAENIQRSRAVYIAKRIGRTVERLQREMEIDVFFDVPRQLFDMIKTNIVGGKQ